MLGFITVYYFFNVTGAGKKGEKIWESTGVIMGSRSLRSYFGERAWQDKVIFISDKTTYKVKH